METRTSLTHPLHIAHLPLGQGALGVTLCPGKHGHSLFGLPWERDLGVDLDAIHRWGASTVMTLVETHELQQLRVPHLDAEVQRRGMQWHHLPIRDLRAPAADFEQVWPGVALLLREKLNRGERILVHCRGGLGRAGTVAACLLMEFGDKPKVAMQKVRAVRPGAIETADQEAYVLRYRPVCDFFSPGF